MHSFSSAQAHQNALASLDETNKKRVLDGSGEYVTTMGFDEAFSHNIDYVYCRAKGLFGANLGLKPDFVKYVRGACSLPTPSPPPSPPHSPPPSPPPPCR